MTTITNLPPPAMAPAAIRRSAEALETAFLAEMLKTSGLIRPSEAQDGGTGEDQFTSFLADAHAQAIVARGGLGLADQIERGLLRRAGAA